MIFNRNFNVVNIMRTDFHFNFMKINMKSSNINILLSIWCQLSEYTLITSNCEQKCKIFTPFLSIEMSLFTNTQVQQLKRYHKLWHVLCIYFQINHPNQTHHIYHVCNISGDQHNHSWGDLYSWFMGDSAACNHTRINSWYSMLIYVTHGEYYIYWQPQQLISN